MLPWRGPGPGRPDYLPLPPARMPPLFRGRPRKRWRWVGAFGERFLLCAGYARIGPVPQAWWAVWDRAAEQLHEGTATGGRDGVRLPDGRVEVDGGQGVRLRLSYAPAPAVEVVSPHGDAHIWTAKRAVSVRGELRLPGQAPAAVELDGLVDDSAGYHARETAWRWSCGAGVAAQSGARVAWNLAAGVHDVEPATENTLWVDGVPHPLAGPVSIGDARITGPGGLDLAFHGESARVHDQDFLIVASSYEQPFGAFTGTLPVAGVLRTGAGVTERHSVRW